MAKTATRASKKSTKSVPKAKSGSLAATIKAELAKPVIPGELRFTSGDLEAFPGRHTKNLTVINIGDRPIQVGSHCHFFEVNRALRFDREQAFGFKLCIPAGTAVRFEPGEEKRITLVMLAGHRMAHGINGLTDGSLDDPQAKANAMARAGERGFLEQVKKG